MIAIAVVQRAGMVLIGRRPEGVALAGYWEFPGGKVRPGETVEEAAVRECREETGVEVCLDVEYLVTRHRYAHGELELHFFAAAPLDPASKPIAPFCWVPLAALRAYRFPPANAEILARLAAEER